MRLGQITLNWKEQTLPVALVLVAVVAIGTPDYASPDCGPGSISWTTVTPSPINRLEAQGAAVEGKLYVFGGFFNENIEASLRSDVYDPATDIWTQIADLPEKITHAGTAVDGRQIYLAGGFVGDHPGPSSRRVWKYDIDLDNWEAAPSLPAERGRGGGGLVRLGRELHFFAGGTRDQGGTIDMDWPDHWVLQLDGGTEWTSATPLPNPRNHVGHAELGGEAYAVGGQHLWDEGAGNQSSVHVYNTLTQAWRSVADMPRPLGHIAASTVASDGCLIVAGGVTDGQGPVANIVRYGPQNDTWAEITPLPETRQSPVVGIFGNQIIVTTGSLDSTTWRGVIQP